MGLFDPASLDNPTASHGVTLDKDAGVLASIALYNNGVFFLSAIATVGLLEMCQLDQFWEGLFTVTFHTASSGRRPLHRVPFFSEHC